MTPPAVSGWPHWQQPQFVYVATLAIATISRLNGCTVKYKGGSINQNQDIIKSIGKFKCLLQLSNKQKIGFRPQQYTFFENHGKRSKWKWEENGLASSFPLRSLLCGSSNTPATAATCLRGLQMFCLFQLRGIIGSFPGFVHCWLITDSFPSSRTTAIHHKFICFVSVKSCTTNV